MKKILRSLLLAGTAILVTCCCSHTQFNMAFQQKKSSSTITVDIVAANKLGQEGLVDVDKHFKGNNLEPADYKRIKLNGDTKAFRISKKDPLWDTAWKKARKLYVIANLPDAFGKNRNKDCQVIIPLKSCNWKGVDEIVVNISNSQVTLKQAPKLD